MNEALKHTLEFWSSIVTFAGGLILSFDAFFSRNKLFSKRGGEVLRAGTAHVKSKDGGPLPTSQASELKQATWSQWVARIGFMVMSAGFLLDLITKW